MIKIAYVINYIVKNGPSNVVLNLINNLDREKYNISLITLFSGNDTEVVEHLNREGIPVYDCKNMSRFQCLINNSDEFESLIEKLDLDIIHSHGLIPDVLSSRLKKTGIRRIATIHNNMYEDYRDTYGYIKSRLFIKIHLKGLRNLDECVCCSKSVYDVIENDLTNACFIRNGIEPVSPKTTVTREQLGIPSDARVFIYSGNLSSGKNIVWLIKQFVNCHEENEYFLVLGKGEKEEECRKFADDHVQILGFQTDPISYLRISDVYMSASKSEGFSISVLEALSCGLLLFLSDIPSHREVIKVEENRYLGECFLNPNFEKKICDIRNNHFDKHSIITCQNYYFSSKNMTESYENMYEYE